MKRNIQSMSVFLVLMVVLLFWTGCGSTTAGSVDLMEKISAKPWPDSTASMEADTQEGVNAFSWDLFLRSLDKEGNVVISPTSVYLALAMTMNGAKGETLTAMQEGLHISDLDLLKANEGARNWIGLLRETTDKTTVSIANSIWVRQEYDVNKGFLQNNADYFDAGAMGLDFSDGQSVDIINGWVKDNTGGKIDKIVEEISQETMMYLINAVYFKSDWKTPFLADDTTPGTFQGKTGSMDADFMHRVGGMDYIEGADVQGVLLPYETEGYTFFALLPEEGQDVTTLVKGWNAKALGELIESAKPQQVTLSLPKFETRFESSLNQILSDMGMGVAFDTTADFSGMSGEGTKDLYISEVLHKTFARVDEKGTEAAAVTSVEMQLTSMPLEGVTLTFDRPFIFGIWNNQTGTPLFVGRMEAPQTE